MADREKVIQQLEKIMADNPFDERYDLIPDAIALLKEQDSIISALRSDLDETLEVVAEQSNVVRCKDCIYKPHCAYQIHAQTIGKENDWFCADGVRRDV